MMDISYQVSTHAYIHKVYNSGGYETIGGHGEYGQVDPDTGFHYKALGGKDHRYSKDLQTSSSYPKTGFFLGPDDVDHEDMKESLKDNNLFSNNILNPVIVMFGPRTTVPAYQYAPPERSFSKEAMENSLDRNGITYYDYGDSLNIELESKVTT